MKIKKDPDAVLDYTFDWSDWLGLDNIASHSFVLAGGVVVDASVGQTKTVTAWVSGGTLGQVAELTCRVVTTNNPPRTDDRTLFLNITQR